MAVAKDFMASRTFEQWVSGIFDHEVTDPEWHWAEDADHCIEPDEKNVEYLTRLFTECDYVLAGFDNAQVNQGLNFIASKSCSDHGYSITHGTAAWPIRQVCIRSIYDLYAKCFAARCSDCLSHLDECDNPLNCVCYMWWDILGGQRHPATPSDHIEATEYIAVLERCLTLSHRACQEAALHGLGHWQMYHPRRVELIIDSFIRRESGSRPELLAYARRARDGAIA